MDYPPMLVVGVLIRILRMYSDLAPLLDELTDVATLLDTTPEKLLTKLISECQSKVDKQLIEDTVKNAPKKLRTTYECNVFKRDLKELLDNKGINYNVINYVYVLRLENGKYFVGYTYDLVGAIMKQFKGTGSWFTKINAPIELINLYEGKQAKANEIVAELMFKHGADNVRGGSYSQVILKNQPV